MMRKIGLALLCASGLFTTNAFSTTSHVFTQGVPVEFELPVNDPQVFSNVFFWTIKASCTVISPNAENPISVKMLSKKGKVNDLALVAGDSMGLVLQNNEKLMITAESGAKVQLVNLGDKTIKAICNTTS